MHGAGEEPSKGGPRGQKQPGQGCGEAWQICFVVQGIVPQRGSYQTKGQGQHKLVVQVGIEPREEAPPGRDPGRRGEAAFELGWAALMTGLLSWPRPTREPFAASLRAVGRGGPPSSAESEDGVVGAFALEPPSSWRFEVRVSSSFMKAMVLETSLALVSGAKGLRTAVGMVWWFVKRLTGGSPGAEEPGELAAAFVDRDLF